MGAIRELDHRITSGVEVSLGWNPEDDSISIKVWDKKATPGPVRVLVAPEKALDAFNHPFAYLT